MDTIVQPLSPSNAVFAAYVSEAALAYAKPAAQRILRRARLADVSFRCPAGRQGGVAGGQYLRRRETIGGFGALKSPWRGDIAVVGSNSFESDGGHRRRSVPVRFRGAL